MSRKTNRDHAKRQQRPMIEDEAISAQIEALLTPAIASQKKYPGVNYPLMREENWFALMSRELSTTTTLYLTGKVVALAVGAPLVTALRSFQS